MPELDDLTEIDCTDKKPFFNRVDWRAFWAATVVCFIVYFFTLAPTVTLEDSGELAVAGDWLGVPHPPGYPIWTMAAWIFTKVFAFVKFRGQPNPAWSIGLLSAVLGALSAGLTALLICRSGRDILRQSKMISHDMSEKTEDIICWAGGFASSLLFAFTPIMWSQAVIVEVYTLNAFFLVLVMLFTYMWVRRPENKTLFMAAFLFGLGLTNYQVILLAGVALAICIMFRDFKLLRDFIFAVIPPCILIFALTHHFGGLNPKPPINDIGDILGTLLTKGALPPIIHPTNITMYFYLFLNCAWLSIIYFIFPKGRTVAPTILFAQLGLAFYIYMPIVSDLRNPPMNWGYPRTWEGFLHAIKRGQYEAIAPAHIFTLRFINQIGVYLADLRLNYRLSIALIGFLPFAAWHVRTRNRNYPVMKIAVILATITAVLGLLTMNIPGLPIYKIPALGVILIAVVGALGIIVSRTDHIIQQHLLNPQSRIMERLTAALVLAGTALAGRALVMRDVLSVTKPLRDAKFISQNAKNILQKEDLSLIVKDCGVIIIIVVAILLSTALVYWLIRTKRINFSSHKELQERLISTPKKAALSGITLAVTTLVMRDGLGVIKALHGAENLIPKEKLSFIIGECSVIGMIVVAILLATTAVYWLLRTKRIKLSVHEESQPWLMSTTVTFIILGIGLIALANIKMDIQDTFIQRVKFISSHMFFAFWIGYGLIFLLSHIDGWFGKYNGLKWFAIIIAIGLPVVPLLVNEYDKELLYVYGGAEQNGHDFGWQFGNYQLRGAEAIIEELSLDEEPLPNPIFPPEMGQEAIFFGGTDPGRFVPTYMIYSADVRPDVYLITQNALADNTYMSVMRDLYGNDIWIPSVTDSAKAFSTYISDIESGKRPMTAGIKKENGRVQISGVLGVMEINGILAKDIFDYNNYKHEFYVEESYVIRWMYPYLMPHGLIMKIQHDRMPRLTPTMVNNDIDFWDWYTRRLTSNEKFTRDVVARKSFSKLRSAIAGLYASRGLRKEAETAFLEARKLYELSPEANFRLAEVYMRSSQFDKAIDIITEFGEMDPANTKVAAFTNRINGIKKINQKIRTLEKESKGGKFTTDQALTLANLYKQVGQTGRHNSLLTSILNNKNLPSPILFKVAQMYDKSKNYKEMDKVLKRCMEKMPPNASANNYIEIARMYTKSKNAVGMRDALAAYLKRTPNDWRAWMDLALIQMQLKDPTNASASLGAAIRYGGTEAQQAIQKNPRLNNLLKSRSTRTQNLLKMGL